MKSVFDDEPQTVGDFLGMEPFVKGDADPALITNDCVGLEIELEHAGGFQIPVTRPKYWDTHGDGSLRDGGIEWVFTRPLSGKQAVAAIEAYGRGVETARTTQTLPQLTARTSLHVHVDVTDLTPSELIRLLMIYSIFELPLFRAYAPDRVDNHFCVRYNQFLELLGVPRALNKGMDVFSNQFNTPNVGRYCALNIKAVFKFGSVEFRHHPGTLSPAEMLEWVNACLSFKRAAKTEINFREMFFQNCQRGFEDQIRMIFPRSVAERMLSAYPRRMLLDRDVIDGIRFVQNSVTPRILI